MGAFNTNTQQSQTQNNPLFQEWQVVSDCKSTRYINKISQDEFVLKMVDYSIREENTLKMRQFYTFEHNPRVVVLVQNTNFIQLIVQDAPITLKKWLSEKITSQLEVLMMIKTIIQGFRNLKQKYGTFYITEKMVRVNSKGKILLWINEKFQSNQIDYKLPEAEGQETMLFQILKLFSNYTQGFEFQLYTTFEKSISYINKILMSNSLRETQCTESKKTNSKISTYHHSRRHTEQFKTNQTVHSFPIATQILRETFQSKNSNSYMSKVPEKNPQKIKKHKRFYSSVSKNLGPFQTQLNASQLVESVDGSEQSQHDNKHQNSNMILKGQKRLQNQFQIHLKSTLEDHAMSFEMKKNSKIPIIETINEVSISKQNISKSEDSPLLGLRLKKSDSREQISSPQIRKIKAQLDNLL